MSEGDVMIGARNTERTIRRRPIRLSARALRMGGPALIALLLIGVLCMTFIAIQPTPKAVPAETSATSLAVKAVCVNKYVVVAFGDSKALDGGDVLVAERPFGGVRGISFRWTINDGGLGTARQQIGTYTWSHIGVWSVTLTVTDLEGAQTTDTMTVKVVPKADGGPDRYIWENDIKNLTVTLNASMSDSETNITAYVWSYNYSGTEYTYSGVQMTFNFSKPGVYPVQLMVTDELGNIGFSNTTVHIKRLPAFYEKHWMLLFIDIPIIIIAALMTVFKYRRDRALFTPTDREKVRLNVKTFRQSWTIFKANRLGLSGLIILIIFVLMAVFAPLISTVQNPNDTNNFESNQPLHDWFNPLPPSMKPSPYSGLTHPFGTDQNGADIYSSTMYGARASLEVGLAATLISVIVGAVVGLAAGYFGRFTDEILMRTTDFFLVIPWFPLMIVMMAILGQKFIWVIVVIGITSWPSTARIVRSQVLTVKERQFIVRAKCVGASDSHILRTHIMPNVLPLIFANTVLLVAIAIFNEAFLDFFGLGDPSVISWGTMLEGAYAQDAFVGGAWWWILAPGAAIVIIVLAFSLVGYAIDDVLNPKLRRR